MKRTRYFQTDPRKVPHLYDEKLSVKNWRSVYKIKYGGHIDPRNASAIEQFIERLLLNTIKKARTENMDELFDAV